MGAMLGGSAGCGRASEEVGTLYCVFGLHLLSMTLWMCVVTVKDGGIEEKRGKKMKRNQV